MVDNGKAKAKNLRTFLVNTLPADTWTTSAPKRTGCIVVRCKSSSHAAATDVARVLQAALTARDIEHSVHDELHVSIDAAAFAPEAG